MTRTRIFHNLYSIGKKKKELDIIVDRIKLEEEEADIHDRKKTKGPNDIITLFDRKGRLKVIFETDDEEADKHDSYIYC